MRFVIVILCILCFIPNLLSQEEETISKKELKQLAKEARKAQQLAEEEQMKEIVALMLEYRRFVLEADYVSGRTGSRISVNSNLNFVVIDSTKGTLQLGNPYGIGYNGLGGITLDGRITRYELKEVNRKKGKSYMLTILIMTSFGTYDIAFNISETGYTDATVRGNTSGQVRYSGRLVPIKKSRVFKGTSTF